MMLVSEVQTRITFLILTGLIFVTGLSAPGAVSAGEAGPSRRGGSFYSPGGWATLHRSPANRKLVGNVALADSYDTWSVLAGSSVLTAPTMSPDGRTLYVTTGQALGESNLHAYSLDGDALWESDPWSAPDKGVDPCAILSSPIVDYEGNIFIGDCNQLFAFDPSGALSWVVPLPEPRSGDWVASEKIPVNALTTAAFTEDGDVFGVTNFGDVVVFARSDGTRLNEPMRLPGHMPSESTVMPMPESVFGNGLVDPEIREWAWQLLVGGAMPSANTPAVDPVSGRVFVAATSTTEGRGALYGLDLTSVDSGEPGGAGDTRTVRIEIGFMTEMGPGSGSSPSLSPASDVVYVSDENGRFYGVDSLNGAIRWEVETQAASAAAAVGPNGDIYTLQAYGPALVAITESGEVRWQSDLSELAQAALPKGWLLGNPEAIGNGNPTVLGDIVLVPVVYGYPTNLFGRRIPFPVRSSLVAVDAANGRGLRDVVGLEDDSTGITAVLPDGTILNSLGTAMTSGVTPLARLARMLLPGDLEPLLPVGGLQVSRPMATESAQAQQSLLLLLAERSEIDRRSDAQRRPEAVLRLAGVAQGDRVVDLMAGSGWYSEVLARAVGASGQVIAQNNETSASRSGKKLADRFSGDEWGQVETIEVELDALDFEPGSLDAAFMVQFYHDTVWMGVDRGEMNRRIFAALAPGGRFIVIDHQALLDSGLTHTESTHRIEDSVVEAEVSAAGFRLARTATILANSSDDRTENVFADAVRGRTDRFLMIFEKPGGGQ
jgi:predicted methyltransferase/outer membrane protein assembly factor BamB